MAFVNMYQELLGVPGTNLGLVKTKINEALVKIQDECVWSFMLQDGGWLAPGLLGGPSNTFLSPGTMTVVPFTQTIYGDPIATAAWTAPVPYPPLITQQQIRVPYYSLYSITALGNSGLVSYITVTSPGSGQAPGVHTVAGVTVPNSPGSGASAQITVNADGTVTLPPVILAAGSLYTQPPTFTLAAGGTPATFTAVLQATLTIDRPWMEPPQVNGTYMIYQAYFPSLPGFKRWYNIRDTTNNYPMDWWSKTQIDLANEDAERINFNQPAFVVPYKTDTRQGSATIGQMLYELWPHPLAQLPYTFACQANSPALIYPTDTVPFPLTDEVVKWRAYEVLYLWKESQKGDDMQRGSGSNFQFLVGAAKAEYKERVKEIKNVDRNIVDLYFSKMQRTPGFFGEPFATVTGGLNVGGM